MPDDKTEAQTLQTKYYGKPKELAVALSRICLTKPGVGYQLFTLLDSYSKLDVGLLFLAHTSGAVLSKMAATSDGYVLCRLIYYLLTSIRVAHPPPLYNDQRQKDNLIIQLLTQINIQIVGRNDSTEPRQLSQTEMDYYVEYNKTSAVMWESIGVNVYSANAGKRNDFDSAVCWQLPMSGAGYVVYNQNDLHKDYPMTSRLSFKDDYGYDQIGTKETIEGMINIAKEWANLNTGRQLQYGDISRPGGVNTPDHHTHNTGKAFDVRMIRKDTQTGNGAGFKYTQTGFYDQELTKKFILLIRRLYPTNEFYFNDSEIYGKKEFSSFVSKAAGHNDHIHVMFPGGKEK